MTKEGNKIPDLTIHRVREQLADETDSKAIKRLTVAREYLEGLSPDDIEAKYGWDRQTRAPLVSSETQGTESGERSSFTAVVSALPAANSGNLVYPLVLLTSR